MDGGKGLLRMRIHQTHQGVDPGVAFQKAFLAAPKSQTMDSEYWRNQIAEADLI